LTGGRGLEQRDTLVTGEFTRGELCHRFIVGGRVRWCKGRRSSPTRASERGSTLRRERAGSDPFSRPTVISPPWSRRPQFRVDPRRGG
jgi:hypothetical protein